MLTHDDAPIKDSIVSRLEMGARMVALIAFGLLPVFFIPYLTAAPLGYTKIVLATGGLFLAVALLAFAVLRRGTMEVRLEYPVLLLWAAFLVALLSSLFSGDFMDSLWGTEIGAHATVFIGLLALTTTVFMHVGRDRHVVIRLYLALTACAFTLALFHIFRIIFGADMLGFGYFAGNLVLSPFSEWNSLGIFFGLTVILSLVALEQLSLQFWGKVLFVGAVVSSFIMLAIINFTAVFVVLAFVGLVLVVYTLTKGKFKESGFLARTSSPAALGTSLGVLIVSIIFVVGGSSLGSSISNITGVSYMEVRPSLAATIDVAKQAYRDHALLGVGANRFADAWRMYRDQSINTTVFWGSNFEAGYGYIPTIFVTQGILGGLVWIAFLLSFIYIGIRTLVKNTETDRISYFISLSSFVAGVYLWGMALIYVPSPVLLLLAALCSGIFFSTRFALAPSGNRTVLVMQDQRRAFVAVGVVVLLVVASVGSLYSMSRHYGALYTYRSSFIALAEGKAPEQVAEGIRRAFNLSEDDLFATQIALYERDRMAALIASGNATPENQALFSASLASAIDAAGMATQIDPTNPETWATVGRVYQVIVPLNIADAYTPARDAFEQARVLDPQNPARVLALAELERARGDMNAARSYIERAIALKSNYTDAIFALAQIQIQEGNMTAAIESTRATTVLDPQNPVRFFQLGVLQLSANNAADAAVSLERALTLSPEYSNARYFLAFAYDALGRVSDAKAALEDVLARNPGSPEVIRLIQRIEDGRPLRESPGAVLPEASESADGDDAVSSGEAPDSPLLSPVNSETSSEPAS